MSSQDILPSPLVDSETNLRKNNYFVKANKTSVCFLYYTVIYIMHLEGALCNETGMYYFISTGMYPFISYSLE